MNYYFDAGAVVKIYTMEPGSTWVRRLLADWNNTIYINSICIAEVAAALGILRRTGRIPYNRHLLALDEFYEDTDKRLTLLDVTIETARYAAHLTLHHPLKGYDAVHLATALSLAKDLHSGGLPLTFVAGDAQIIRAAQSEGLSTANPFDYAYLDYEGGR